MGRDKALLSLPGSGEMLWQRQLRVLEELEPEEIFWSGPARTGTPGRVRIVSDSVEKAGPLAGIAACLGLLRSDLLVVLAIDLPQMNATFLRGLLERCPVDRGVVALRGDFFEPLAAVYPKRLDALAATHLREGRYALQDFVRQAIKAGAMQSITPDDEDATLFKNLNRPEDLETD